MREKGFSQILILIILVLFLVLGVYLVFQKTVLKSKASYDIEQLNNLTKQLESSTLSQQRNLLDQNNLELIAQKRNQIMTSLIRSDTNAFLENVIPENITQKLPANIQKVVERKIDTTGKITQIVSDEFKDKSFVDQYVLKNSGNNYSNLFFDNETPFNSGDQVQISGYQLNSDIAVQSLKVDTSSTASTMSNETIGEQKTAIVLMNFTDDNRTTITQTEAQALLDPGSRINGFMKDASYDQTFFSGRALNPVTIDRTGYTDCFNFLWSYYADQKLADQGIHVDDFTRIIYIFPYQVACKFDGSAEIGVNPSRSWINGVNATGQDSHIPIIEHELGHNLGLSHAKALGCGDKTVDVFNKCKSVEYGDPSDVMGDSNTDITFNAPHRLSLNWLKPAAYKQITESGTYTLSALDVNDDGLKIMEIPLIQTDPSIKPVYALSYRILKLKGVYNFNKGLSVHYGRKSAKDYSTYLLDNYKPGEYGFSDAALEDGESFYDQNLNISITQRSHSANSVTFDVRFNTTEAPINKPRYVIPDILPMPTNLNVSCANDGPYVTFSWNPVFGADQYLVRINKFDDKLNEWMNPPGDQNPTINTNNLMTYISPERKYLEWSVQPIKNTEKYPFPAEAATSGEFSCSKPTKKIPAPASLKLKCSSDNSSINLSWDGVKNAAWYMVRVNKSPDTWDPNNNQSGDFAFWTPLQVSNSSTIYQNIPIIPNSDYVGWSVQSMPLAENQNEAYKYGGEINSAEPFSCPPK